MPHKRKKLILISQVYPPDPAAVGQHFADAMERMVHEGWDVTVVTANRGYDNPRICYPSRENRNGVNVRRLSLSSFGKSSFLVRLIAQAIFSFQATTRLCFGKRPDLLVVGSSPPFAGLLGVIANYIRGVAFVWWPMDINPDQMVTSGRIREDSLPARLFEWANRATLSRATTTIVLDEQMRQRVAKKVHFRAPISVVPPWSHDHVLEVVTHEDNWFRDRHKLQDTIVVMYSGNHGLSTPLETLLSAAKRLENKKRLRFVFIGGGVAKQSIDHLVEQERPPNITSLPYQPFDQIQFSLSAADVHVVSIADEAVGIIHPCKLYGALAIGRPIISLGPRECHASQLVVRERLGWTCQHGAVDELCKILEEIESAPASTLAVLGENGRNLTRGLLSRDVQLAKIATIFENAVEADA